MQSQEMICGGRYLSCDDAMRVFAAGSQTNEMRIEVRWRSGKRSVVNGVRANRLYEISEPLERAPVAADTKSVIKPLFEDVSDRLNHVHEENAFDDYQRQPTLPFKLSQPGPALAA